MLAANRVATLYATGLRCKPAELRVKVPARVPAFPAGVRKSFSCNDLRIGGGGNRISLPPGRKSAFLNQNR